MGNEVILSPAPSTRAPSERSWDGTKSPVRCAKAMKGCSCLNRGLVGCAKAMGGVYLAQQGPCQVCRCAMVVVGCSRVSRRWHRKPFGEMGLQLSDVTVLTVVGGV